MNHRTSGGSIARPREIGGRRLRRTSSVSEAGNEDGDGSQRREYTVAKEGGDLKAVALRVVLFNQGDTVSLSLLCL